MAILISVCMFAVLMFSILAFGYMQYVRPARLVDRLSKVAESRSTPAPEVSLLSRLSTQVFVPLSRIVPTSQQEMGFLRRELVAGGFRTESAVPVFLGLKIALAVGGLLAGLALRHLTVNPILSLLIPAFGLFAGYGLPGLILHRLIDKRRERVRFALADALDLLVVCAEAGCGLDQGISHVTREFRGVHPEISEEFALINMELLAGASRATALRNFATRTGEPQVKKLVAILIQTDRFGTSISDALRAQADFMRVNRRQEAEERAGKVGVKLVFPIFFFCMPCLVILVAGPGIIQIVKGFAGMR